MKKYFSLLLTLFFFGVAHAQLKPVVHATSALGSKELAGAVEEILTDRVARTYTQAWKLMQKIPSNRYFPAGFPACGADITEVYAWMKDYYAPQTFLTTQEQTENFLVARNNRLFIREIHRMQCQVWPALRQHLKTLTINARHFTQPQEPLGFVAQKIAPSVKNLLLGEAHNFPEIRESVGQFLHHLRQAQPQREIFLFTEFLPARYHWKEDTYLQDVPEKMIFPEFNAVWQQANSLHMQVVGLEDPFVHEQKIPIALSAFKTSNWWKGLEGLQVRNNMWLKILDEYRQQHPDALFIIYAGDGHLNYTSPFSLSSRLPAEQTFVFAFSPNKFIYTAELAWRTEKRMTALTDPLELLTHYTVPFPQRLLFWNNSQLARTAGFDARLKIEVDLNRKQKRSTD